MNVLLKTTAGQITVINSIAPKKKGNLCPYLFYGYTTSKKAKITKVKVQARVNNMEKLRLH